MRTGADSKELIIKMMQLNDRDFLYVCYTKDVTGRFVGLDLFFSYFIF